MRTNYAEAVTLLLRQKARLLAARAEYGMRSDLGSNAPTAERVRFLFQSKARQVGQKITSSMP